MSDQRDPKHDETYDEKAPHSLDELIDEAKQSLKPGQSGADKVDWEKIDATLFARIEAENSGVRESRLAHAESRARAWDHEPRRGWQVAGLLAAAAAIAFVLHRPQAATPDASFESATSHATATAALTLTKNEGGGNVRVNGEMASAGLALHALDTIETTTARADLVATDTKILSPDNSTGLRTAWMLEDHSEVAVRSIGGSGSPLVLDLMSGTVEAQVTPVLQGEAFAIDLRAPEPRSQAREGAHEYVRIAVHGTHLRVTRDPSGNHATIDLSEGVVSIGFPPKSGSTYGMLVTAPAHVELDLAKFFADEGPDHGAIVVDKNAASVRAPIAMAAHASAPITQLEENVEPPQNEGTEDQPESHATTPADKVATAVDPHAEETIRAAAQACAVVHESSNEVRVTVSSKLILQVGSDGLVKMARFEPPLPAEAQQCAGKTIYKTHFLPAAAPHEVSVPVVVNN